MHIASFCSFVLGAAALMSVSVKSAQAAAVIRSAGGDTTPASITGARDQFRLDLGGGTTAGANGSFGGVRREINWDGVPASFSAPNNLPANFFNVNSPRGVVFTTPGTGFQVSSSTADAGLGQPALPDFGNIGVDLTAAFEPFSPQRLFTSLGSNIMDVNFFLPGTTTPATVSGFGSIFSDVDNPGSTTLQFFDIANSSLGTFVVPAGTAANASFSFLGVSFNAGEQIGRVRITSGAGALGATGVDNVVMDDFLYSEPRAAAVADHGSTALLLALSLVGLVAVRREVVPVTG